jgi:hypothetical protein
MRVHVLLNQNPYFGSSASSNRWLTLIDGLKDNGVEVKLWIVGGYQSKSEKKLGTKVNVRYLSGWINNGLWKRRLYQYLLRYLQFCLAQFLID